MKKALSAAFLLVLIASFFLPAEVSFLLMLGMTVACVFVGFFIADSADVVIKFWGSLMIAVLVCEGAHFVVAKSTGVPVSGGNVSMLFWDENTRQMGFGYVELAISEQSVNASQDLQSKISWVSVAGSIGLFAWAMMYFLIPSASNYPAVIAVIAFVKHQLPILSNDQSVAISHGWMSSTFAWLWFAVGILLIGLAVYWAIIKKREPLLMEDESHNGG